MRSRLDPLCVRSRGFLDRRISLAVGVERERVKSTQALGDLHDLIRVSGAVQNRHQARTLLGPIARLWFLVPIIDGLVALKSRPVEDLMQAPKAEQRTLPFSERAIQTGSLEIKHLSAQAILASPSSAVESAAPIGDDIGNSRPRPLSAESCVALGNESEGLLRAPDRCRLSVQRHLGLAERAPLVQIRHHRHGLISRAIATRSGVQGVERVPLWLTA